MTALLQHDERTFNLPLYDKMRQAIVSCYRIDEVKDIRDRASAYEIYAKLARDPQNERLACEIRIRAERRAGELLNEMEKSKGGRPKKNSMGAPQSFFAEAKEKSGTSDWQALKWQQLAAVPDDQFEAALAGPNKPSTSGIIEKGRDRPLNEQALWLWGRLRDFESKLLSEDPWFLYDEMTDGMKEDTTRLVPLVIDWLERLK